MKKETKQEKGITLIALIITIIILVILAAVTIRTVYDMGIMRYAVNTAEDYSEAVGKEESILGSLENVLATHKGGSIVDDTFAQVEVGARAGENSTINGGAPSSTNPVIPEGYIPINQGTAVWGDGTNAPTSTSVNAGLVITDNLTNGNEWVWVPVNSTTLATLYTPSENASGVALTGVTTTTSKYTSSEIISGLARVTPGDTSAYREPDLVTGSEGTTYDAVEENRRTAGFVKEDNSVMSLKEMADEMVSDYEEMLQSIRTYGGFYIGRYELSSAGVKKDQAPKNKTSWYELYAMNKNLGSSNGNIETRMIWGSLWDVTCNWIAEGGYNISSFDANDNWGNYKSSSFEITSGKYCTNPSAASPTWTDWDEETEGYVEEDSNGKMIKQAGASVLTTTGSSEHNKAKNIYDLAGNTAAWTQEAVNTGFRAGRGSNFNYNLYVSSRNYGDYPTTTTNYYVSSRPALYVN